MSKRLFLKLQGDIAWWFGMQYLQNPELAFTDFRYTLTQGGYEMVGRYIDMRRNFHLLQ